MHTRTISHIVYTHTMCQSSLPDKKKKRKREKNTHLLFAPAKGWEAAEKRVDEKRSPQRDFHEKEREKQRRRMIKRGEKKRVMERSGSIEQIDLTIHGYGASHASTTLIAFFSSPRLGSRPKETKQKRT